MRRFTIENAKDILAFGFNPKSTFIFSNLDYVGSAFYENIILVAREIQVKNIRTALGFDDEYNVLIMEISSFLKPVKPCQAPAAAMRAMSGQIPFGNSVHMQSCTEWCKR